ncbi:MAG: peptide MFS transporter [Methanobacterium sp.]
MTQGDSIINNRHPKGLYVLFFTEMWERFSYYGMRAILSLYMIQALLFNTAFTSTIYGYYTGLVYLTPLLGGYIADRYWGNRRSIVTGGILMALGQFSLAASSYFYVPAASNVTYSYLIFNTQEIFFLSGLFLLVIGNGFFKPNISSMLGHLYPQNDERRDSAFTIFYMGINLGALFSPFIVGGLGNTGNPSDFMYGFLAAGTGMIIGLMVFILGKNKYLVTPEGEEVGSKPSHELESHCNGPLTKIEKDRIKVIFILSFFVIFFFAAFEQAGVSLTFFAEFSVDRLISSLNYIIPASYFQSVNPFFIILLAPIFAAIWPELRKRGLEPSIPVKMAIGLIFISIAFMVILPAAQMIDAGVSGVSPLYLVGIYLMMTIAELCISPIGLSMVSKLSPIRFSCFMMGVWFLSAAASNFIAGLLSTLYPSPSNPAPTFLGLQIDGLTTFFMIFVVMAAIAALILMIISRKLSRMMHGIQ